MYTIYTNYRGVIFDPVAEIRSSNRCIINCCRHEIKQTRESRMLTINYNQQNRWLYSRNNKKRSKYYLENVAEIIRFSYESKLYINLFFSASSEQWTSSIRVYVKGTFLLSCSIIRWPKLFLTKPKNINGRLHLKRIYFKVIKTNSCFGVLKVCLSCLESHKTPFLTTKKLPKKNGRT